MRKVIAAVFVSLDGVMQAPGGPEEDPTGGFAYGGWTAPYWDDAAGEAIGRMFAEPFDLLLGRMTYDIFAAYWPYQEGPIADPFNAATKYVATRSPDRAFGWAHTVALRGDAAAEVAALKQQDGPNLLIQGSSDLIQTLLAQGQIDEFRLKIFPLVLGRGKRLFGDGAVPAALELAETSVSTTGVVMNTYRPAGQIVTGSFASDEPSDAELDRRRTLADN